MTKTIRRSSSHTPPREIFWNPAGGFSISDGIRGALEKLFPIFLFLVPGECGILISILALPAVLVAGRAAGQGWSS
jgi:hypothetical protein